MSLLHRAHQALQPRAFLAIADDIEYYGLLPRKCAIERSQQKLHILAWAQQRYAHEAKGAWVSGMCRRRKTTRIHHVGYHLNILSICKLLKRCLEPVADGDDRACSADGTLRTRRLKWGELSSQIRGRMLHENAGHPEFLGEVRSDFAGEHRGMRMEYVRGTVAGDIHAGQATGQLRPTASEPRRLPGKPESVITVGAYRPLRQRLVAILYSSAVQCVDSAELRIYDSNFVASVGQCQRLLFEKDPLHGKRRCSIP